jgi:exopolysaccharide biosynthesis WecB/TagA/CpsF family protein
MADTSPPRHDVHGVGVHAVDYPQATVAIISAARERRAISATALAVHGVMTGRHDAHQRARINQLDLVTPDGQPVRWALNWLHRAGLRERVYGPFLMLRLCACAAAERIPIYLYGSTPATLAALQRALSAREPALEIAGAQPSRFRQASTAEWAADVRSIRDSGAGLVFCGLGCPRQEAWAHAMRAHLDRPVVAVGAAFALWAGEQPMAPSWMQHTGLEWLFRFFREPRRLARRYLVYNPLFVAGVLRQKFQPTAFAPTPSPSTPPELHWS